MNDLHFQDFVSGTINPNNDPRPPNEIGDQSHLFTSDGVRIGSFGTNERNFFSFKFYQQYFDVDTDQVLSRILYSMFPRFTSNFITDHVQPLPDLWGPLWISITLVFSTAICGNLAKYIQTAGSTASYQHGSDFRLVTGASTIIFCYVVLVPFVLYSLLWFRKSYLQYSYLDILCAYGYSLSVFIPVSVFWVFQAQWFRWLLIFVSVALSGSVLVGSIWPAVKNDHNKAIAFGTILTVLLLHSLLAVGFKEYYFDASLPTKLERENFHSLHQQVKDIEHSHAQLVVNSIANHSTATNNTEEQQTRTEKLKDDNGSIGKKGNDIEQINVTMTQKQM